LTLGGRYSYERKTVKGSSQTIFAYTSLDPESRDSSEFPFSMSRSDNSATASAIDYRLGLDWDVAKRSLLYANVATGFHAGGVNPGAKDGPYKSTYDPERLTAFAIGSKNRFLDGLLQLNLEAYYWSYKNLQVTHIGSVNTGGQASEYSLRTDTAGRATVFGVDLDADYLLTDDDLLTASVLWNESKYNDFSYADVGSTVDASGRRLSGAPRLSVTLSYQHTFKLGEVGTLTPGLRTRYQSGVWMYYVHVPGMWQERYTTTDLTVNFSLNTKPKLSLTAYVRNLEGSATVLQGAFDSQTTGTPFVMLNPPRTYGIMATGSF
jgi:iron complex outermembrane receptor protein